jgi:drug/metabolite transporter (DMT)-like permease
MPAHASNLRGIIYMVLASGCFTINNALLKLAVADLPPLETLFLRAVAGVILGVPVLLLTAPRGSLRHVLDARVLSRNAVECAAAIAFVFAVANAPLADITALLQLTPMLGAAGSRGVVRRSGWRPDGVADRPGADRRAAGGAAGRLRIPALCAVRSCQRGAECRP